MDFQARWIRRVGAIHPNENGFLRGIGNRNGQLGSHPGRVDQAS